MAEDIKNTKPEEKVKKDDIEIIVYHNDIDGVASAYVIKEAKKLSTTSKNVVFISYDHNNYEEAQNKIRSAIRRNSNIYFVDVSPKVDFFDELISPNAHGKRKISSITVIDHHETPFSKPDIYNIPETYDNGCCAPKVKVLINPESSSAAKLVWDTLMGTEKKVPDYITLVDKMDRNNLKTKDEFAAAAYADTKPIATPAEGLKAISGLARMSFNTMVLRGRPIINAQKQVITQLINNSTVADIEILPNKKAKVPLVNADVRHFGRQINKYLVELGKESGGGLAFAWYQQSNGKVSVSIRSNGEPNSSEVAKHLKETFNIEGGGHPDCAAVIFPSLCKFEKYIFGDLNLQNRSI